MSIIYEAFTNCTNLKSVTFNEECDNVIDSFRGCENLEEVTVKSQRVYQYNLSSGDIATVPKTFRVLTSIIDGSNSYLEDSSIFTKSVSGSYTIYTRI